MYIYVYMYIYMYIFIYVYIYICICIYICAHIYIYIWICIYCTHTHTPTILGPSSAMQLFRWVLCCCGSVCTCHATIIQGSIQHRSHISCCFICCDVAYVCNISRNISCYRKIGQHVFLFSLARIFSSTLAEHSSNI